MATIVNERTSGVAEHYNEESYEKWRHWPVNWTAVGVGVLSAVSIIIVLGLFAVAIGIQESNPENRLVDLYSVHRATLIFSICTTFFSFVVAGWIAGKVAGILHSEPAMLHGAIVWCGAVPVIAMLAAIGASGATNTWFSAAGSSSLASPPYDTPYLLPTTASDYERSQYDTTVKEYLQNLKKWRLETPKVVRNSALCAASALLLALIGSVLGGWIASGEPMSLTYQRGTKTFGTVS